jgi:hypothetical protein
MNNNNPWFTLFVVVCVMVAGIGMGWTLAKPARPSPAPRAEVGRDTVYAVATQVCRKATLGDYEIDSDFPGRVHAWLWLPKGFKPGDTLVLITKDAREIQPVKVRKEAKP